MLKFLSDVRLGASLAAVIIAVCVLATMLEQEDANKYVYFSGWFIALCLAFGLNLLLCTFLKVRFNTRFPGFFAVHMGVVLVIIGGVVTGVFSRSVFLKVEEGETRQVDWGEGEALPGFGITLKSFEIEYQPPMLLFGEKVIDGPHERFGINERLLAKEGLKYKDKKNGYGFMVKSLRRGEELRNEFDEADSDDRLIVKLADRGEPLIFEANMGETFRLDDDLSMKIVEKLNDFSKRGTPQDLVVPANPAVLLTLTGVLGTENRWLFSKYPDFAHEKKFVYENVEITYSKKATGATSMAESYYADVVITGPDGKGKEITLESRGRWLYEYAKGRGIGYYQLREQQYVREYRSHILIAGDEEHVVRVNHPATYMGCRIYQSSYIPGSKVSIFHIKHDPGVTIVFLGYIFLCFGMIYYALFYPILVRKKE